MEAFSDLIVANIQAGGITASEIITNSIQATTAGFGTLTTGKCSNATSATFNAIQSASSSLGNATASTLAIATDTVTVGGQTLRDFIIETVQNAGLAINNATSIESGEIATNTISPLAEDGDLQIGLDKDSVNIQDGAGNTVSSLDNDGECNICRTSLSA